MPRPTRSPSCSPRRNARVDRLRRLKDSSTCIAPSSTPAPSCRAFNATFCCSWPPRRPTRLFGGLGSSLSWTMSSPACTTGAGSLIAAAKPTPDCSAPEPGSTRSVQRGEGMVTHGVRESLVASGNFPELLPPNRFQRSWAFLPRRSTAGPRSANRQANRSARPATHCQSGYAAGTAQKSDPG